MADRYRTILLFGAPAAARGPRARSSGTSPASTTPPPATSSASLDLQSEIGRKFWEYASRGELVPDEFTIKLWKQYIKGMELINQFHPETEILVLDGMPRNVTQARLLRTRSTSWRSSTCGPTGRRWSSGCGAGR